LVSNRSVRISAAGCRRGRANARNSPFPPPVVQPPRHSGHRTRHVGRLETGDWRPIVGRSFVLFEHNGVGGPLRRRRLTLMQVSRVATGSGKHCLQDNPQPAMIRKRHRAAVGHEEI